MPEPARAEAVGRWTFPRRLALAVAVALLVVLLWLLVDVLLLLFGAAVLATALRSLAHRLRRHAGVPARFEVLAAVLVVLAVASGVGWMVGDALAEQASRLGEQLPRAWAATTAWLERSEIGRQLLGVVREALADGTLPRPRLASVAGSALGALGSLVLMLVIAIYLATDPEPYRDGLIRLLPHSWRERTRGSLQASREGLRRWLLGQGVAMLFIGTATGLALWLLGVPLAPILGLIAGLLAFVPFYGSIAGGVLPVLIAFTQGPQTALWVALAYGAIQQVEEFGISPLVQRRAVALPPVLGLVAALIFGVLLGPMGVVLATPLMVVVMILARKLYVEGLLDAGGGLRASSPSA